MGHTLQSRTLAEHLSAHEEAVLLFKDHAANDPTPAIKDLAAKTLPKLRHHIAMVKELSSKHSQAESKPFSVARIDLKVLATAACL